jgi:hypothetical protein
MAPAAPVVVHPTREELPSLPPCQRELAELRLARAENRPLPPLSTKLDSRLFSEVTDPANSWGIPVGVWIRGGLVGLNEHHVDVHFAADGVVNATLPLYEVLCVAELPGVLIITGIPHLELQR